VPTAETCAWYTTFIRDVERDTRQGAERPRDERRAWRHAVTARCGRDRPLRGLPHSARRMAVRAIAPSKSPTPCWPGRAAPHRSARLRDSHRTADWLCDTQASGHGDVVRLAPHRTACRIKGGRRACARCHVATALRRSPRPARNATLHCIACPSSHHTAPRTAPTHRL
jgi:hypothetical protein